MSVLQAIGLAGGFLGIATAIYVFAIMRVRIDEVWKDRDRYPPAVTQAKLEEACDQIDELRQFVLRRGQVEAEVKRAIRSRS